MLSKEQLDEIRRLAGLAVETEKSTDKRPLLRPPFLVGHVHTGNHKDWQSFTEAWRLWGHQQGVRDMLTLIEGSNLLVGDDEVAD